MAAAEAQIATTTTVGAAGTATDELRVLVESLTAENRRLKLDLEQHETIIRLLTENLAIARTESELFQKKWSEAQLRAQTLGVNFADDSLTHLQRQVVESVRELYLAQAERQRLVEQLERLLQAVEKRGAVAEELERTKALLAATEQPAGNAVATGKAAKGQAVGTLEFATVLDVNPSLRLVVLNVGMLEGVRVGMPLVVLRGDRVVAELKVVEVRPRICGALIERVEKKVILKAGDTARVTRNS
ncbi:MAG TPA: hypothetical protein VL171_01915 [Verrucomicrobiae bacterium]|nr:hypothetical protein [Verrucomicrobiae bacterium]